MSNWMVGMVLACVLALTGCFGESAEQILKTAKFEELQRNDEHARQLYEQLVRDFAGSPEAAQAAARLAELEEAENAPGP